MDDRHIMSIQWDDYSFVVRSKPRLDVLKLLASKPKQPKELAETLQLKISAVSRALLELADKGLANCLTPAARKGRLYVITEKGQKVLDAIVE